ncbi:hypothetical protein ACA097_11610 [Pseudomonas sp. QL9]|uniref:hypothetical protein n=1 Tax=Pseudomonas sp. QL9 TaxID=3242725 RepID=UPI00352B3251
MKSLALRVLSILSVALLLGACQSQSTQAPAPAASAFESSLAAGQLEQAQLQLGQEHENAAQLAERRQRLADAYIKRSREALQAGDVNGATNALARARSLMPKAPALAADVNGIAHPAEASPVKCAP